MFGFGKKNVIEVYREDCENCSKECDNRLDFDNEDTVEAHIWMRLKQILQVFREPYNKYDIREYLMSNSKTWVVGQITDDGTAEIIYPDVIVKTGDFMKIYPQAVPAYNDLIESITNEIMNTNVKQWFLETSFADAFNWVIKTYIKTYKEKGLKTQEEGGR